MGVAQKFSVESSSKLENEAKAPGKDHYLGLDFLRGIAAFAVILLHCRERFELPYLCPHGYLAVDFFFVLSGFVIARAYYTRLSTGNLTMAHFARIRAIRLMPLIFLATLAAAVIEIGRPGITDQRVHLFDTAQAFLFGSTLIPMLRPNVIFDSIFPLVIPVWSLFFEAIANGVFAIFAKLRVWPAVVPAMAILTGMLFLYGIHVFGTVDFGAQRDTFWFAFGRVGWSFTVGILLYRFREYAPRIPFDIPLALLGAVLIMPLAAKPDDVFDLVCVFFLLPLIVWLASTAEFGVRGQRLAGWSGDLSYPLYALHFPFLRIATVASSRLHLGSVGHILVVACTSAATIGVAAMAYRFYDVPVRKWLSKKTSAPRKFI